MDTLNNETSIYFKYYVEDSVYFFINFYFFNLFLFIPLLFHPQPLFFLILLLCDRSNVAQVGLKVTI